MVPFRIALAVALMPALPVAADDAADLKNIHEQARASGTAFSKGYDPSHLKWMHPKLIAEMGGADNAAKAMKATVEAMAKTGLTVESYKATAPTTIRRHEGKAYALYLSELVMKTKEGDRLASESNNLAVQEEKGGKWYFIRIKPGQEAMIRKLLPELPKDFELPEAKGVRRLERN